MTSVNTTSSSNQQLVTTSNTKNYLDFIFSEDGKSAVKFFKLTDNEGKEKLYSFRIYFSSKSTKNENIELLKKYKPEKVETLGKMSVELGLGETYKGMTFSGSGEKGRLDLTKRDGTVENISSDFSLNSTVEKAQEKLRMYKTLAFVNTKMTQISNINSKLNVNKKSNTNNNLTENEKKLNELSDLRDKQSIQLNEMKTKLIEAARKLLEETKDCYIDDIKVSIYYEDLFDGIHNKSEEEILAFLRAGSEDKFKE